MEIGQWLRGLGLESYEQAFRDNGIDLDVLTRLTADDLKEIGVVAVGHRRKILDAIEKLAETASADKPGPMAFPHAERRQLTVMFCDLVGSTALSARLDPEDMQDLLRAYQSKVVDVVCGFGGYISKFLGDGVLIYFGYPQAHEDDAECAIRAGLSLVRGIRQLSASGHEPLHARIGIATGLVVVGDLIGSGEAQERGVAGETPNLAARLQSLAEPGAVIIADGTRRLVGDLFELSELALAALKGFAEGGENNAENSCDGIGFHFARGHRHACLGKRGALENTRDPRQWVMQTGDYSNHRFSKLKQITADNVGKLQVAWTFSTGVLRGHEGGPLVIGDVMYVHAPFPNTVFALDLNNDGKILWKYEPKQDPSVIPVMCCDTVNRGVAYADGMIFLHQADTTLVALDAKTGKIVWSVKNGDPTKGETGTSAPVVVKDKVLAGISGAEFGVRGHLTAYDMKTGKRLWRAYSTGPDNEMLVDPQKTTELGNAIGENSSLKTWEGDQWKIGGGSTWGWYSYDPELNLIYYGTANPSTWNPVQRPGDNKWSMTIFARDPDTGMAKWAYQMTPHDQWDYDGINEMILADQNIGGKQRKMLVHFDRNGFGYTLDRETGELLVAEKYDPAVNWATKIDMEKNSKTYGRPLVDEKYAPGSKGENVNYTGICPAALGTKDQQPASYSPETGLFYVPTNHVCMDYEPFRVSYTAGQPYVGATLSMYPPKGESHMGNFIAWDATKGKIVWSNPEPFSVWSGALSTVGGVVFYGTLEGYLKAVDAKTGKELYKFKTPSGIIGNVTAYEHKGKQYVAVLSGVGGWAGIGLAAGLTDPQAGLGAVGGYAALSNYTSLGGTVTVFALPGG